MKKPHKSRKAKGSRGGSKTVRKKATRAPAKRDMIKLLPAEILLEVFNQIDDPVTETCLALTSKTNYETYKAFRTEPEQITAPICPRLNNWTRTAPYFQLYNLLKDWLAVEGMCLYFYTCPGDHGVRLLKCKYVPEGAFKSAQDHFSSDEVWCWWYGGYTDPDPFDFDYLGYAEYVGRTFAKNKKAAARNRRAWG